MTKAEVASMIDGIKLPYRYSHFTKTPSTPYIIYYYPSENDVMADDSNYVNKRQLFIELYTNKKDFETEALVETELRKAGLSWYKTTDFLSDEKLFQTTYESEVIING